MTKTKIICTIGPASNSKEMIKKLALAGMDIARLNFSHGTKEGHKKTFSLIQAVSKELGMPIGVLQDLEGHKIRIGALADPKGVMLKEGAAFYLTNKNVKGDEKQVTVCCDDIAKYAKPGTSAFIDDGNIELRIEKIGKQKIQTKVIIGGLLGARKGIHLPGIEMGLPPLGARDRSDINFGVRLGVDYIAQSFVRTAQDVAAVKRLLARRHAKHVMVIAKIEDAQGIRNIDSIIEVSDGIMIARGDMGVCVQLSEVPLIQKMIIKKCNQRGIPVITATQMLDSMMRQNRPTRAEVTDVANAIIDGTDVAMLSGETASGLYPLESVKYLDEIACTTEASLRYENLLELREIFSQETAADAVGRSARELAQLVKSRYILAFTLSGQTAKIISRYRPKAEILAITPDKAVLKQLILYWGVKAVEWGMIKDVEGHLDKFLEIARRRGILKKGDVVVATAGINRNPKRPSGMIKVMTA